MYHKIYRILRFPFISSIFVIHLSKPTLILLFFINKFSLIFPSSFFYLHFLPHVLLFPFASAYHISCIQPVHSCFLSVTFYLPISVSFCVTLPGFCILIIRGFITKQISNNEYFIYIFFYFPLS